MCSLVFHSNCHCSTCSPTAETFLTWKFNISGQSFPVRFTSWNLVHCTMYVLLIGERAKRARHYQGCTNLSWCGTYIYIYIYVWRYVCQNSSACHAYVMWAELGHCHFLYVPAVLNVVTTGNGTGTKKF